MDRIRKRRDKFFFILTLLSTPVNSFFISDDMRRMLHVLEEARAA